MLKPQYYKSLINEQWKERAVIVPFLIFLWLLSLHQGKESDRCWSKAKRWILQQQIASFLAITNRTPPKSFWKRKWQMLNEKKRRILQQQIASFLANTNSTIPPPNSFTNLNTNTHWNTKVDATVLLPLNYRTPTGTGCYVPAWNFLGYFLCTKTSKVINARKK